VRNGGTERGTGTRITTEFSIQEISLARMLVSADTCGAKPAVKSIPEEKRIFRNA
jgi:hypothetical protein